MLYAYESFGKRCMCVYSSACSSICLRTAPVTNKNATTTKKPRTVMYVGVAIRKKAFPPIFTFFAVVRGVFTQKRFRLQSFYCCCCCHIGVRAVVAMNDANETQKRNCLSTIFWHTQYNASFLCICQFIEAIANACLPLKRTFRVRIFTKFTTIA